MKETTVIYSTGMFIASGHCRAWRRPKHYISRPVVVSKRYGAVFVVSCPVLGYL